MLDGREHTEPLDHPHSTLLAPTVATPTPAIEETKEYVDDTWAELRVHHITQMEAPAEAQAKARSCTGALPLKAAMGIIPFLIVEAVRAPTARAPVNSKTKHSNMAWRYVTERDDTLVAQAFATSSGRGNQYGRRDWLDVGGQDILAPLLKASNKANMVPKANT